MNGQKISKAMRCATKWLLVAVLVSVIAQGFVSTTWLIIGGNQLVPHWAEVWIGSTLMALLIAFLSALIGWFSSIVNALRCK